MEVSINFYITFGTYSSDKACQIKPLKNYVNHSIIIISSSCPTSKDAGIVSEIRKNMDSFCESMDSYRIVTTNPDFKRFDLCLTK